MFSRAAVLLLLGVAACSLPDSYHLGTSYGVSEFDRPVTEFDTYALYAGVSWHVGERARHKESLEATRRLEVTTATGHLQPLPAQEAGSADDEHITDFIPPPPQTRDEAWNLAIYGLFLLTLAAASFLGVLAWKKYKKNGNTP